MTLSGSSTANCPVTGVDGIRSVNEQRALARARALETQAPAGIADHAGQERQGFLEPIGWQLKDPKEVGPNSIFLDWFAGTGRGDDGDHLGKRGQGKSQPYVNGPTVDYAHGRMHASRVPGQLRRDHVVPADTVSNTSCLLSLVTVETMTRVAGAPIRGGPSSTASSATLTPGRT